MNKVYQIVTDRIIAELERGVIPWHRPWISDDAPRNMVSGREYRGVNVFLLACQPFDSPYWMTFRQAQALGGSVRKRERGTPIVFWRQVEFKNADGTTDTIPILRYYTAFNLRQCNGITEPAKNRAPFAPIESCQRIVTEMPDAPALLPDVAQAFYRPSTDTVHMPAPEAFDFAAFYYSVRFHELVHATGHPSRLNRSTLADLAPFGTTNYSKEELVAELGAAMLCGVAGITNEAMLRNSAAYLAGWTKALRGDSRLIVSAASQAQRAADFILGKGSADAI